MKSFFLTLGAGTDKGLPSLLSAMSCGAARQPSSVSLLRILAAAPSALTDRLMSDLCFCHDYFAGEEAFAFFRTDWQARTWQVELPGRDALTENEESRLLLRALRGEAPLSFRTDREAAAWSMSALLEAVPQDFSSPTDESFAPFVSLLSELRAALSQDEDVRLILLCDLSDGFSAGLAVSLLRFLRVRFPQESLWLGLIGLDRSFGAASEEGARAVRSFLAGLRDQNLVRAAEGRDTLGADACWLLGLPAALRTGEESLRLLDWAAARVAGQIWTDAGRPSAGIHTREIPGTLTLSVLDQEARPAAAFLRGTFWLLSDLFPALASFLDHPALLRSLAPATRGGLFRKLFRDSDSGITHPPEGTVLDRTLRALSLEILSLLQSFPPMLKEAESSSAVWQDAVSACGRAVTLASEYDVRRQEAEESGVDKVQPVHRVSLQDTEEEGLLRRLDQMAAELSSALARRSEVFQKLGGFFSRAALQDCLDKCLSAEKSAREKLAQMPSDSPEERFSLGLQARRIRLLEAAVSRCRRDLSDAEKWESLSWEGSCRPASPFAGEILDPALAEQAFTLLTSEGEAAEAAAKAVRDGISSLLKGYTLNDAKTMLRNLISVCRAPDPEAPLRSLLMSVFSVCGVEVFGLRFQSVGTLPPVPLLPDLTEGDRFFTLAAAPERMLVSLPEDSVAGKRGLLALMLLREYRRRELNDAALEILPLSAETSVLARAWLFSRGKDRAFLCSLRSGEGEEKRMLPLAVLLPGLGLEPARLSSGSLDLLPSFAFWLNRDTLQFQDPCPYLSEGDRQILTEQLTRLRAALNNPESRALSAFLSDWHRDIMQAARQPEDGDSLRQRLRVACGLGHLPIWQKELRRVSFFYEAALPGDPLCAALCGSDSFEAAACTVREDTLYIFRDLPIAREHPRLLLVSAHTPEESLRLASLNTECDILFASSDDYHEALAAGLQEMIHRYPEADPEALQTAEALLKEASEPVSEQVTELTWPWDTVSASVLTILTECLGKDLALPALRAFSSRLALFPARGGEILGDALLSQLCLVHRSVPSAPAEEAAVPENGETTSPVPETDAPDAQAAPAEIRPDAALPPLSPDFAAALCRSTQGQSLLQPGFLALSAEGSSIRAEVTLEGAFTLKLIRIYQPEEVLSFYAHNLPTLALWPSLPFAPQDWHAYYSYVHAEPEFQFTAVSPSEEAVLSGGAPRLSACQREFPVCYLVRYEGQDIGAVPNLLPPPEIPEGGSWIACIDFGASAASIVFTDGTSRWPMQGPVTVRTLLRSPAASEDLLWREFLPAVPVSALLPCALRIFRNDLGDEDLPLRDGAVFMSSSLGDVLEVPSEALYTDLKWNGEKGRSLPLYLHQVMLMAALQARCGGASSLGWRAAVPDEMATEGRERLADSFRALADRVSGESGLPFPEKQPSVSFAPESTALGTYFRFCSSDQTRGGFMTLDLGADTADLSLFLQGRPDAVRSCQLPLGLHNMLLPSLLRQPGILMDDFGFVEDADFQQDLRDMISLLEKARGDPSALRHARYGLDAILADHLPLFLQALAQRRAGGAPGRTGSLILLYQSFLMMLSGLLLLQISGDSLRNDTLPDTMTLFLAGRGSILLESLSMQSKTSLWKLLTMFRNQRVHSLTLVFSAEKKMEIPVGLSVMNQLTAALPRPAAPPAAIAVRPEELIPEFLTRFRREFPGEAALLFPGIYSNDFYAPFTPYGQQLLSQALQSAFDRRETGRPFPALLSCLNHLLEMIQEGSFYP